ncbi:unnamed protein product [Acanthoscelides obtectus]|uniref:Uncharacterized protein n=1 Tax=Acanthoscelides obtectus TaxID=200917 RepID=A0A9P0QJT8_ACAOB|nr:unnamed protein product [Acanthoscelides obtectus]CAK1687230.1 hypothetical protein AOBTE_LOCUS36219 [Acanthoscelides obtectus]
MPMHRNGTRIKPERTPSQSLVPEPEDEVQKGRGTKGVIAYSDIPFIYS